MISSKLLAFVSAASVMVPHAAGLKATQPTDGIQPTDMAQPTDFYDEPPKIQGLGVYESDSLFKNRGLRFSVQPPKYKVLESKETPYPVRATLVNEGITPVTFLRWGSPFEEKISYKIFRSIPKTSTYLGYIVGRESANLPQESLITLNPGEEISSNIDVNKLMAFHEERTYKVSLNFPLLMFDTSPESKAIQKIPANATQHLLSATIDVKVQVPRTRQEVQSTFKQAPADNGCTAQQMNVVDRATRLAAEMTDFAIRDIERRANPKMYSAWLGQSEQCPMWDPEVTDIYRRMKHNIFEETRFNGKGYTPDCGQCAEEMGFQYNMVYAYVYPGDVSKRVHMCGVFWEAPHGELVRDSQPGTIIHELSHFEDIGGTEDHAYGTGAIQDLARQDACTARANADNIEAYAEYVQTWSKVAEA